MTQKPVKKILFLPSYRLPAYMLVPTLFSVPALLVLLVLGGWQVQRLHWKENLIDQLETRADLPPVTLPYEASLETEDWQFRAVELTGRFLHDSEFHVLARALDGEKGLHLYTLFERSAPLDSSDMDDKARYLLVNRGWMDFAVKEAEKRPDSLMTEEIKLTGILRFDQGKSQIHQWVLPDPDLQKNLWYARDIAQMERTINRDLPAYYIMDGTPPKTGSYPQGRQWRLDIPNNHLQYALTWFGIALSLVVIYAVYWQQGRKNPAK